jgi:hypothetical protein
MGNNPIHEGPAFITSQNSTSYTITLGVKILAYEFDEVTYLIK